MSTGTQWTFLALCFARLSIVRAEDVLVECKEGESVVHTVTEPGRFVMTCVHPLTTLLPPPVDDWRMNVYQGLDSTVVPLKSIIPGAHINPDSDGRYWVTIKQLPLEPKEFFLICTGSNSRPCSLRIKVDASPRLGPNRCTEDDAEMTFSLQARSETARFGCGEGQYPAPKDLLKAYDASCSQEIDLPSGVIRTEYSSTDYSSLQLVNAKKQIPDLCLVCLSRYGSNGRDSNCKMRFVFKASQARATHASRSAWMLIVGILAASFLDLGDTCR